MHSDINLLFIETSGSVCSAGIWFNGEFTLSMVEEINAHSKLLAPMVSDLISSNDLKITDLDAVAISQGPGSYTGLRIGASLAKGLCFSSDLPLISVSTLQAWAHGVDLSNFKSKKILVLIDARRENAYAGLFDSEFKPIREEEFVTLDEQFIVDWELDEHTVICGTGANKLAQLDLHCKSEIAPNHAVTAKDMMAVGLQKFKDKKFENLMLFEPNYIKAVHVTKPKSKI